MILAFYIFRDSKIKTVISQTIVFILFNASQILLCVSNYPGISIKLIWFNQALSLLALIFIFSYNGKKGKNLKYLILCFLSSAFISNRINKNFYVVNIVILNKSIYYFKFILDNILSCRNAIL